MQDRCDIKLFLDKKHKCLKQCSMTFSCVDFYQTNLGKKR